ncbi:hypothetical protein P3F02_08525 [Clostridium perfringens]|uniref:hypothetical protein n=1 Tax=Clostridium perfringens TaxID=1502 RepID=UPI0028E15B41|nr:hypothetical protein [Clostridium perfringens]MDT9333595.1 hypothetical protein [Clostridium perfringens]
MLKDILIEYTYEIIYSEGVNYTSSLFLFSSDFSVVVIADKEISRLVLIFKLHIKWVKYLIFAYIL